MKVLSYALNSNFNINLKKDLKASKKDLGSFCAQYGISMPTPPSTNTYDLNIIMRK